VITAKLQPERPARQGATPSPSFWETRLAPFLESHFIVLCLSLIGIACARIIATYNALSLTTDEPDDFASGLEYLSRHVYTYNIAHPPLSRVMQALGPYLMGARPPNLPATAWHPLDLIALTGHPERTIFLMRFGNLPFYVLACLVVCGLSWYAFGKPIAVVATGLYTLLPAPLADAGLAITDLALGATLGAAIFAAILWARNPTWLRALILGVFTAFACLSKFTAFGYLPSCLGLALIFYLCAEWPGLKRLWDLAKQRAATFLFAAVAAAMVIWAGYRFSVGTFSSHRLGRDFLLPAPELFAGLKTSLSHNIGGHGSYLLGHFGWSGWWYYFPVALAVKTPIAILLLSAVGFFVCVKDRFRAFYLLPVALTLGILLPALRSHIDIGIRHIEPIWIGLSITSSLGFRQLLQWTRNGIASALSGGALIGWLVLSVAYHHPDYVAYFNGFAGSKPELIMVDSNYDWGQDLRLLAKRLRALGAQNVSLAITEDAGYGPQTHYAYLEAWYGLPPAQQVNTCAPAPGWNVVSTTVEKSLSYWAGARYYRGPGTPVEWYEQVTPTERLGPLLLYDIPPDSKLRSGNCNLSSNR
jgi:hypothetical protein